MKEVTIHEAKTHLSRLIREVEQGASITLKRGDKVVARIVPATTTLPDRVWGQGAGKVEIKPDFDDPLPEEIQRFFGP